jgi:uncharacterized membrane protein YfcA
MSIDLGLSLGGFLGGVLVGLTGMGGGALLTPMLVFFFHVDAAAAVGSDLVASLVMKPIGGAVHWRSRTVRTDIVRWLCIGSVPGAFAGVALLQVIDTDHAEGVIKKLLGVALLLTAITMIVRDRMRRHEPRTVDDEPHSAARPIPTVLLGLFGGGIVGMTSVGSGSLMVVVLSMLYPKLPRRELVGTDLVQAIPLVGAAAIGHLLTGDVRFGVTSSLLLGAVPGVYLGARFSATGATTIVRQAMPVVLIVSGLKLVNAF